MNLKTTLLAPEKPGHIPRACQWLSGEGAGSWFYIRKDKEKECFWITRYSALGKIECTGCFKALENGFNVWAKYQFIHLSHCQMVTISQKGKSFVFHRI